jgi:hypothetical protein
MLRLRAILYRRAPLVFRNLAPRQVERSLE